MNTHLASAVILFGVIASVPVATRQVPRDHPPGRVSAPQSGMQRLDREAAPFVRAAEDQPTSPSAHHQVGVFYFGKTRDMTLTPEERQICLGRGLAAEERALDLDPDLVPALVYKNLFLRTQALAEQDPEARQRLIREADELRARALELQKSGRGTQVVTAGATVAAAPPPPPPPAAPDADGEPGWVYATTRLASPAGGRVPTVTKQVRPIHAPMLIAGGVTGVVVLDATVDARGKVSDVRVVQSVSMLTQAAIDAVRQWEFDPSTVDASGSVVRMTATFGDVSP